MKNRSLIVLTEQIIMTAVFVICAAICLQIFSFSKSVSRENEAVYHSAFTAQNTAEELKYSKGAVLNDDIWQKYSNCYYLYLDENWNISQKEVYRLEVSEITTDNGLCSTYINIYDKDTVLFGIPVAWQEVDSYE